jgi:probable F420-dependent oxidoreductase
VDIGIYNYIIDTGIDPVTLGRAVEDHGFESLFVGDHTHYPVASSMPETPGADDLFLSSYGRFLDPFVALTAVAVTTSTLRIGTSVVVLPQREPVALAKAIASLDHLSGGRFIFGCAPGWNEIEFRNHGIELKDRFRICREYVQALRHIWTHEVAEFHGNFVDFEPMYSWPKPVQAPGPPVLVGGFGPRVIDRVFDYGDGWLPIALGGVEAIEELAPRVAQYRQRARDGGRSHHVTVLSLEHGPAVIEAIADAGFDRSIFITPPGPEQTVMRAVEEIAQAVARLS